MVTYITPSITIGVHSIVLPVRPSSSRVWYVQAGLSRVTFSRLI